MPRSTAEDLEVEDHIRRWLRWWMQEHGHDQVKAAAKLSVSQGHISRILAGGGIGLGLMVRMKKAFEVRWTEFLEGYPDGFRPSDRPSSKTSGPKMSRTGSKMSDGNATPH